MNLKLLQFIRTATHDQITDMALRFIAAYPDEAFAMTDPDTFPVVLTPAAVPGLDSIIRFTPAALSDAYDAYQAYDMPVPSKVRLVKHLRERFSIGDLKTAIAVANKLITDRQW